MIFFQQVTAIIVAFGVVLSLVLAQGGDVHANAYPDESVRELFLSLDETATDTVYMEIMGGETLIFVLPESLSGEMVDSWTLIRSPARSKLSGRSFVWTTRKSDNGLYALTFEGRSQLVVDEFSIARIETWTAAVRVK